MAFMYVLLVANHEDFFHSSINPSLSRLPTLLPPNPTSTVKTVNYPQGIVSRPAKTAARLVRTTQFTTFVLAN